MTTHRVSKKEEVSKIKSHIRKVFPQAKKVIVKVSEVPSGGFQSFIRVLGPQKKELIAHKRGIDIKKSLEKSHLAIIRQVHRIKTRWGRNHNKALNQFATGT